jgi:molybdopterin/thiamine biosynthesis adenylyltransferase
MEAISDFLKERARGDLVPWEIQKDAAARFNATVRQIEEAILSLDLLPARYARNRTTIDIVRQKILFNSTVAVVGCGGLGGYIIEELSRLGVGTLRVIDSDVFEEHNLNRQSLCTFSSLGTAKVDAARDRVRAINPACEVVTLEARLDANNAPALLGEASAAVDALDNIPSRLDLADACIGRKIPLVHGAVGGWYGTVLTQGRAENTVRRLYGDVTRATGIEESLGTPSFTPPVIASMEAAEVCKLLTADGSTLESRMIFIDLFEMSIATFRV